MDDVNGFPEKSPWWSPHVKSRWQIDHENLVSDMKEVMSMLEPTKNEEKIPDSSLLFKRALHQEEAHCLKSDECSNSVSDGNSEGTSQRNISYLESKLFPKCDEEGSCLRDDLREWAGKGRIPRSHVAKLLAILRNHGVRNVPLGVQEMFSTPRHTEDEFDECDGGILWYAGIQHTAEKQLRHFPEQYWANRDIISLDVFFDGISPHKHKTLHVWPIMGRISGRINGRLNKPFLIGFYAGSKHKADINEYLLSFVSEAQQLQENWEFRNKSYKLRFNMIIADAPGRAYIKNTNSFMSCVGCDFCTAIVRRVNGVMSYHRQIIRNAIARTDESFRGKWQAEFHQGDCPLLELMIEMISMFPPDPMHLLYLGVIKRYIRFLLKVRKGRPANLLGLNSLRAKLNLYAKFYPCEFNRRPTDFKEFGTLKATEYRRILLYDVVWWKDLKGISYQEYNTILYLHCALRILSRDDLLREDTAINDAHQLLCRFVIKSEAQYGKQFVGYNIHLLTHLATYCKRYGNLNNFAAFPFENFLKELKLDLNAPGRVAQQIVLRYRELEKCSENKSFADTYKHTIKVTVPHENGPLPSDFVGEQYRSLYLYGMTVRTRRADAICIMKCGSIATIHNILKDSSGDVLLYGRRFLKKKNIYENPLPSSVLGEYLVRDSCVEFQTWAASSLKSKCVLLPITSGVDKGWHMCIELLHEALDD